MGAGNGRAEILWLVRCIGMTHISRNFLTPANSATIAYHRAEAPVDFLSIHNQPCSRTPENCGFSVIVCFLGSHDLGLVVDAHTRLIKWRANCSRM